jgi:SAM-dependent methyltransferase/uncharacterized protein YbaR (Trm112 family)
LDKRLLDTILCPECGSALELADATVETVHYAEGEREEVKSGAAVCASCGRRYPIKEFVLSFAELFPPVLKQEAAYWNGYYLWLVEQGSLGFHDLRLGLAPYITLGVPEPFPAADKIDRYSVHHELAEHPLLRKGHTLLDIGVGLGWTSLYFARAGYAVTAFEPSLGPVTAAKRYSMEQGVFVEYICAAMGSIRFRPCSFDNVTAFHSLHHVPDLEAELYKVREWLCPGGTLAIDEHVGNSRLASAIGRELHQWAEDEVFPRYRTVPLEALARLPQEPHSPLEDSSVSEVAPLVSRLFDVKEERRRHVFLDHFPLLYYLHSGRDLDAYQHALAIANRLQDAVRLADPEGGDYVTIVAENSAGEEIRDQKSEIRSDADLVAGDASSVTLAGSKELEAQLAEQGEWARGLEREVKRKDEEIARLKGSMRRLENGRVMRLLRVLRRGR